MQAFEIRDLRLVAGLDQRLEPGLHQRTDTAAQDRLFAKEVCLCLFGEGRLKHSRTSTTNAFGIRKRKRVCLAGFVLCFIMSFVNLPISLFLADTATTTLPVVMYSYIESRIDPMLAAVSAILFALGCATTVILDGVFRIRLVD